MKKNLILTAALGYNFKQVELFIKSLRKFYNDKVSAEDKYQDSMYKYVFGWKDPENYPEGKGIPLQRFDYKNLLQNLFHLSYRPLLVSPCHTIRYGLV